MAHDDDQVGLAAEGSRPGRLNLEREISGYEAAARLSLHDEQRQRTATLLREARDSFLEESEDLVNETEGAAAVEKIMYLLEKMARSLSHDTEPVDPNELREAVDDFNRHFPENVEGDLRQESPEGEIDQEEAIKEAENRGYEAAIKILRNRIEGLSRAQSRLAGGGGGEREAWNLDHVRKTMRELEYAIEILEKDRPEELSGAESDIEPETTHYGYSHAPRGLTHEISYEVGSSGHNYHPGALMGLEAEEPEENVETLGLQPDDPDQLKSLILEATSTSRNTLARLIERSGPGSSIQELTDSILTKADELRQKFEYERELIRAANELAIERIAKYQTDASQIEPLTLFLISKDRDDSESYISNDELSRRVEAAPGRRGLMARHLSDEGAQEIVEGIEAFLGAPHIEEDQFHTTEDGEHFKQEIAEVGSETGLYWRIVRVTEKSGRVTQGLMVSKKSREQEREGR